MIKAEQPKPRLPQPAAMALAVPTTSRVNIREVQNWHITNVPPAIPMNNLRTERPTEVFTKPVHAVGIEAQHKTRANRVRAPYLSQSGPNRKRTKIVPPTPTMLEVQTCCLVRPRVVRISGISGAIANQMMNAIKKATQEQ